MLRILRLAGAAIAAVLPLLAVAPAEAFTYTRVVDTFQFVPGGGGAKFILQGPAAVGGGTVIFCDRSNAGKYDVWAANINGAGKAKIIGEGRLMPNGLGRFKQSCGLIDVVGGNLLLIGDDCAGCGHGKGIFRMPARGGAIVSLVDITLNFPGSQTKFTPDWGPGGDFGSDGRKVAFYNGQSIWAVPLGGGQVNEVASLADTGRSPPDPYCCFFFAPTMLKLADKVLLLGRNFFDGPALMTVNATGATNSFRFLVRWFVTRLPGTPPGYIVTRLFGPDTGTHYVFGADSGKTGSPAIRGIYSKNPSTGATVKLADQNTRVPGRADRLTMTFGPFDPPIAAEDGWMVFASDDTGGKTGIYAVPEGGGSIVKIIRTLEPLGNGYRVGALGFGRRHFDGNTVVFTVSYAGNGFVGNGVFSTPIAGP
jgi:hypothetical protein